MIYLYTLQKYDWSRRNTDVISLQLLTTSKKKDKKNGEKRKWTRKEQPQDKKRKKSLSLSNDNVDHSVHSTRPNLRWREKAFASVGFWFLIHLQAFQLVEDCISKYIHFLSFDSHHHLARFFHSLTLS
jgi:hypothetical protein